MLSFNPKSLALLSATLLPSVLASPFFADLYPRAACDGNTASTRSEWCDYSIDTDYMTVVPDTGVTREYWLELTDVTVAPDGVSRSAMAVNGSIPGPTLFADWGDTVVVHVINSLTTSQNGTSIHFHGIRQNYTSDQDGVVSITQCPTAPGSTLTYTWKAMQYGSTWYHSHFALQAWQGIFGGIIINGPATANYDEDKGMLFLNDWDYSTVDELYAEAEASGPPTLDTGLINGTNIGDTGGYRFNTSFVSGTSYRMRLVNAAVDTHFKFSIDNHTMQVIASDLVPITPYNTTVLDIGMGQRYDIIITADQADVASNFWMRAIPQSSCSENDNSDDIRGIIYYDTIGTPETSAYDYTDSCDDETANISPYIAKTVGDFFNSTSETAAVSSNEEGLFRWTLNSTTMLVSWEDPTLEQVVAGNTTYDTSDAVLTLPEANVWMYLVIETTLGVPHPIHLHGHDFWILAQGTGTYSSSVTLNKDNPPRRDTAMLPSSGYLVMAFETDNPGVWLMHCHIGWHTSEGFALQFVERYDEIVSTVDETRLTDNCDAWETFAESAEIEQEDSGV
ncbi:Cupredoxin [Pseudomassariella vexata]|uniref:laccase n=1 Tax=Pseudomassariella vexata TaxID=1141098 RepID=A0A1Y2EFV0_9PEZI|nr:Cupredoxin [Pseudomassariella vexata]ORY70450.1 Cupredoxin [Pseudomassariella vexata]